MSSQKAKGNDGPGATVRTHYKTENFVLVSILLVVGIFATTLPQPQALGNLPISLYLKNQLHQPAEATANFIFVCGFFWYLKPLAGILTDAFPLFGTRRRYYLLISATLAALLWLAMLSAPKTYSGLLWMAVFINLFMVMASTVMGAFLVEMGQSRGATGRLTSVRQLAYYAAGLVTGPLGARIAKVGGVASIAVLSGASAITVFAIVPVAFFLMRECPIEKPATSPLMTSLGQIKKIGTTSYFWLAIVFICLFYFAPGFGTLQLYRQQDVLKLSEVQIGDLGFINAAGSILGTLVYASVVRRLPLRILLGFGVVTAAVAGAVYVFYNNYQLAKVIDFQNGFFFGFCEVALIDLAARATPAGCEGIGYSLILSGRNLSVNYANKIGASLSHTYHFTWDTMVYINAGTTAIVLILLPFMPKLLMGSRDGARPNTENTGEPQAA